MCRCTNLPVERVLSLPVRIHKRLRHNDVCHRGIADDIGGVKGTASHHAELKSVEIVRRHAVYGHVRARTVALAIGEHLLGPRTFEWDGAIRDSLDTGQLPDTPLDFPAERCRRCRVITWRTQSQRHYQDLPRVDARIGHSHIVLEAQKASRRDSQAEAE